MQHRSGMPCVPARCAATFKARSPASVPGVTSARKERGRVLRCGVIGRAACCWVRALKGPRVRAKVVSALALLVTQVGADHHDPTVTADHLALVADLLDARLNLHRATF